MKRPVFFLSLSFLLALSPAASRSANAADAASAPATAEQMLAALRQLQSVLPPEPHVHPLNLLGNPEAVVPPQCYTRTEAVANPCYVCHQDAIEGRENRMNDADLQSAYSFSEEGMTNHWHNLFEDRSARVAAITDEAITRYVQQDNYSELAPRLRQAGFKGWIPDLQDLQHAAAAFDSQGFAKDGSHWVAFSYKPFPSTFWPTNGSTDDVMIRLPAAYRTTADGTSSRTVYLANLCILETNIKDRSTLPTPPLDEAELGQDLDGDGSLGTATQLTRPRRWLGAAQDLPFLPGLYPEGTEFLHSVRYLGVQSDGEVGLSTRMKELRYMRKARAYSKAMYARRYDLEANEKVIGNLPSYPSIGHHGLDNGNGWALHGFIEDRSGRLRALTYEENFSCMGCHNSVGSTIDKTFSFPRKQDGPAGWRYIDLHGMKDAPSQGETTGEIALYLQRTRGGSEFRHNDEMQRRWFHPDGTVDPAKLAQAKDVHDLIVPSPARALQLNKAYRCIVEDQDYIHGKDPTLIPPANVYPKIDNRTAPTLPPDKVYRYNILLKW